MPEPFDVAWIILKAPLFQRDTVSDVGYSDAFNFPTLRKPELGFQGFNDYEGVRRKYSHFFESKDKNTRAGLIHLGDNNYAIDTFAVGQEMRERGLGRQGLAELKSDLQEAHGEPVNLIPHEMLDRSVPFWDKMGQEGLVDMEQGTYLGA